MALALALALLPAALVRFRADGSFTILMISDMHYAAPDSPCLNLDPEQLEHVCSHENTTRFVRSAIADVKPDLLVFSGDNIHAAKTRDPEGSIRLAFTAAIEAGIPWVATFGNHDEHARLPRESQMRLMERLPFYLSDGNATSRMGDDDVPRGAGTFALHVAPPSDQVDGGLSLYVFDSGSSRFTPSRGLPLTEGQSLWLAKTAEAIAKKHAGSATQPTALAFLHIPLPEFRSVANVTGSVGEAVGTSKNSGSLDALNRGGAHLRAVFAGHDHLNDYCGDWAGTVRLCYAGAAGYQAYGRWGVERRVRVIKAHAGGRQISTFKVLDRSSLERIDCEVLYSAPGAPALSPCDGHAPATVLRSSVAKVAARAIRQRAIRRMMLRADRRGFAAATRPALGGGAGRGD
jgi:hypothetical protein